MRFEKKAEPSRDAFRAGVPYLTGVITADTYDAKAIEFVRASGYGKGEMLVIRYEGDDDAAWEAWLAFLAQIGKHALVSLAHKLGLLTVPTKYPWEFSVNADRWRDKAYELAAERRTPQSPSLTPERRRQLASMLRGTIPQDLERAGYKPRRPNNPRLPDSFGAARKVDPDAPIAASPELLAILERRSDVG